MIRDAGAFRLVATDLAGSERSVFTYAVASDDPLSASVRCAWTLTLRWGEWGYESRRRA